MAKKDENKKPSTRKSAKKSTTPRRKSAYKLETEKAPAASKKKAAASTKKKTAGKTGASKTSTPRKTAAAKKKSPQKTAAKKAEETTAAAMDADLGDNFKQSIRKYLLENVVPEGKKKGDVQVNLDADFIRDHGPKIVSSIFQSVAEAFVPEKVNVSLDENLDIHVRDTSTGDNKNNPQQSGSGKTQKATSSDSSGVNMSVNVDVLNVIKGLFTPPKQQDDSTE